MADYLKAAHAVQMEMIYVFGGILAENKALLKTRFQSYFLNIAPTGKTFSWRKFKLGFFMIWGFLSCLQGTFPAARPGPSHVETDRQSPRALSYRVPTARLPPVSVWTEYVIKYFSMVGM